MYCSKCGTQNDENNNFCSKCGELLEKNNSVNNNYNENKSEKLGLVSLILGIISLITSLIFIISIPVGIIGLILGIKSKTKNGFSKAGIILSIIGISLTILFIIAINTILSQHNRTYYGEAYYLDYNKNWSITTLSSGQEALQYKNEKSYLVPIGNSVLSDAITNFDTTSGQEELYNMFCSKTLYKDKVPHKWRCNYCGYEDTKNEAWKVCPLCCKPQGYVQINLQKPIQ